MLLSIDPVTFKLFSIVPADFGEVASSVKTISSIVSYLNFAKNSGDYSGLRSPNIILDDKSNDSRDSTVFMRFDVIKSYLSSSLLTVETSKLFFGPRNRFSFKLSSHHKYRVNENKTIQLATTVARFPICSNFRLSNSYSKFGLTSLILSLSVLIETSVANSCVELYKRSKMNLVTIAYSFFRK